MTKAKKPAAKAKPLNSSAKAAKVAPKNSASKEAEQLVELDCDISNLEDLQAELIDAVESGKEKSITRIEKEILELKDKIRKGMNDISGKDSSKDYEALLSEARDILKVKTEPIPFKAKPKPVKKRKFTKKQLQGLSLMKRPKKKKKPKFNIIAEIAGNKAPLSERLIMLQAGMTDFVALTKSLLENSGIDEEVFEEAEVSWLGEMLIALDMETEGGEYFTMTDTIKKIRRKELEG